MKFNKELVDAGLDINALYEIAESNTLRDEKGNIYFAADEDWVDSSEDQ